ncbi:MAG: DUF2459 domain-containing protein [Sphingopyxis sp.]|nr:DUF2459 domain-containing protein [Sphingopyxis sp.]
MKAFRINSWGSALRALACWPLLALGLYMAAALIGGLIPVNRDWVPPSLGHSVYLYDNGIHTSLIIPRAQAGIDLGRWVADPPVADDLLADLPEDQFPGPAARHPYLMFGWGDARFFRETPRWADLRPGTAVTALVGSGTMLMHVERLSELPVTDVKRLVLRDAEMERLVSFVTSHFPTSGGYHTRANPPITATAASMKSSAPLHGPNIPRSSPATTG